MSRQGTAASPSSDMGFVVARMIEAIIAVVDVTRHLDNDEKFELYCRISSCIDPYREEKDKYRIFSSALPKDGLGLTEPNAFADDGKREHTVLSRSTRQALRSLGMSEDDPRS